MRWFAIAVQASCLCLYIGWVAAGTLRAALPTAKLPGTNTEPAEQSTALNLNEPVWQPVHATLNNSAYIATETTESVQATRGKRNNDDDNDKTGSSSPPLYALLTQFVVTCTVGIGCFLLFCAMRTRWPAVYAPKELARAETPLLCLPRTFFGWMPSLLRIREVQVLATVGPDALMFLRLWGLGIRLFGALTFWALLVLVPANIMASQDTVEEARSRVPLSMDLVPRNSPYLVLYLLFIYFFTALSCHQLHREYRDFVQMRRYFLTHCNTGVHTRTVMVTGIPTRLRNADGSGLKRYFEQLGIGSVRRARVMPRTEMLERVLHERAEVLRALENAYVRWNKRRRRAEKRYQTSRQQISSGEATALLRTASTSSRPTIRVYTDTDAPDGTHRSYAIDHWLQRYFFWCCRTSDSLHAEMTDAIDHYMVCLGQMDERVRQLRRDSFALTSTGFVTFRNQASANIAAQTLNSAEPLECITRMAPEFRDIYWANIGMDPLLKATRSVMILAAVALVVLAWLTPSALIVSLVSLDKLSQFFPPLKMVMEWSPTLWELAKSLLPTIVISVMVFLLRATFERLSVMQGHRTYSGIELSTMSKYFFFQFVNVLLVQMITTTALNMISDAIERPSKFLEMLGESFPAASIFFINYMLLQGLVVLPATELLQISSVLDHLLHYLSSSWTPREQADHRRPPPPKYGWLYPAPVLMFVVALTFSVTAPLILPVAVVFFAVGKLIFAYQFTRVYQPRYEAGGRAWPIVFRRLISGLVLFQLSTAGVLLMKGSKTYSTLALPAILGTLVFAAYCVRVYESQSSYLSLDVASGLARAEEMHRQLVSDDEEDETEATGDATPAAATEEPGEAAEAGPDNDQARRVTIAADISADKRPVKSALFGKFAVGRVSFNTLSSSNETASSAGGPPFAASPTEADYPSSPPDAGSPRVNWTARFKRAVTLSGSSNDSTSTTLHNNQPGSSGLPRFPSFSGASSSIRSGISRVLTTSGSSEEQAGMTRIDGVLDAELKQYAHLAVKGPLPQPWPPAGLHATRRRGVRSFFSL